jgi:hypothetical protein
LLQNISLKTKSRLYIVVHKLFNVVFLISLTISSYASAETEYQIIPLLNEYKWYIIHSKKNDDQPTINNSGYVIGEIYNKKNEVTTFFYHDQTGFKLMQNLRKAFLKMVKNHGVIIGKHHKFKEPSSLPV